MDSSNLAAGDDGNNTPVATSPRKTEDKSAKNHFTGEPDEDTKNSDIPKNTYEKLTPQIIEDNETKLKERIAQCKNIIESLKVQLHEEKEKIHNEKKPLQINSSKYTPTVNYHMNSSELNSDEFGTTSMFTASVDSKLNCDESLIEYEKQLQKYQNTLNMAHNEKKNAIRKQMLAKAFKLKLMEVENQCNIELLRIKQSLQCLEPLQMIANKWKIGNDETATDTDTYELMPNFPELQGTYGNDWNILKDDFMLNMAVDSEAAVKDETNID